MRLADLRLPGVLFLAALLVGRLLVLLDGFIGLAGLIALTHCSTFELKAGEMPVG